MSRIVVVGDLLLDRDVAGTVDRVCPDAPVPVVDVETEHARPGGAGLAAAMLAADGHHVCLVTAVGDDAAGHRVSGLLRQHGVELVAMPTEGRTREKTRVRAHGQSLVRLDSGTVCAPTGVPAAARTAVEGADAVLVCDYAGGMTGDAAVRAGLTAAAARVPVVWDPHLRGAAPVEGTRLVTPNQSEAAALAGGAVDGAPLTALAGQIEQLRDRWSVHAVCATLGPRGALLTLGSGAPIAVPAPPVPGGDTCGAGDRFASAAAAALADGEMVSAAVQLAVEAASAYVGAGGAEAFHSPAAPGTSAPHDPWERIESIRARGGTVVATGGCFDLLHAGHIRLLRDARALGDCLVVCLNSDASVRRLKGPQRPLVPEADRARVLQALEPVDAVLVFEQDTPVEALRRLKPHVWAKGGDYALTDLPEAAEVARWGGQTVVLPYLDGRSTTSLIDAARNRVTS